MMIYKELDFDEKLKRIKLLIMLLLLLIVSRIIFHGGEQQLEYCLYEMAQDRYLITQGQIFEKKDISWYLGKCKLISALEEEIRYEFNGEICTKTVRSYPEYNIKDIVPLAVNIENENDIKRCIPYPILNNPSYIINWMLFFVLSILWINVQNIAKFIQRIRNKKINIMIQNEEKNRQIKIQKDDEKKQNKILYFLESKGKKSEVECEKIRECMIQQKI